MKKYDVIREYVRHADDDELKFLGSRFSQNLRGDMAEAIEHVQRQPELDRCLSSASSVVDFFEMLDCVDHYVQQEIKKRFGTYEQKEKAKTTGYTARSKR